MGLTHYHPTHVNGIPESAWEKICADTRILLGNLPAGIHVAYEADEPTKAPEVSDSLIRFNGIGDDGCETLYLERTPEVPHYQTPGDDYVFVFCKTARLPYDIVVQGVLIVAAKYAGTSLRVTSDGDLDEWMPAFEWVSSLLGDSFMAMAIAARLRGGWFQLGGEEIPDPLPSTDEAEANQLATLEAMKDERPYSIKTFVGGGETFNFHEHEHEPTPEPEPVTTSHTFIVDVREFRDALELAVTEKKTTIPVLTNVLLSPVGSTLRVVSTDLDKWTTTEIPAMIDTGAGDFLLPQRKTLELLKGETGILKITAKVTTLSDKFSHAWIKLSVGGCDYELPTVNRANFPAVPEGPKVGFSVSGDSLKSVIGRIIGCISTEQSRYTLQGALMECDKDRLLLVATDGHRLALDSIDLGTVRTGKAVIPRDSMQWLYKYGAGEVTVSFGAEYSSFYIPSRHTTFQTRNLKGQFPNWQAVTPRKNSFEHVAKFSSADELSKTLTKVARMADERSGAVKFRLNGCCTLSASSTDCGSASATVKASIDHHLESEREIVAGFNSSYVLDVLKIGGKNPVILSMKNNQCAGVFTIPSLPDYQYVLMPLRV